MIPGCVHRYKATAENFDLIAGTLTGGIIALGLSKDDGNRQPQYTAREFADIYATRGREIFPRSLWKGLSSLGGLTDELYSDKGLTKVWDEYFADDSLGSALTKTLITSYDIQERKPLFFKNMITFC